MHSLQTCASYSPGSSMRIHQNDLQVSQPRLAGHVLEICVSAVALIALAPLLGVIAGSIFAESGLPILFWQGRVGRNGTTFRLLKFRSMRQDTKGPSITASGDRRVTSVGRILRKFKLDELPQLWNVVRGEMSLVGPRPEVPEFVDFGRPEWHCILQVRPGITDPASIVYRDEERLLAGVADPIHYYRKTLLPAKLAMNMAYLRERTFWTDVKVILRTARCAAFPGRFDTREAECIVRQDSK